MRMMSEQSHLLKQPTRLWYIDDWQENHARVRKSLQDIGMLECRFFSRHADIWSALDSSARPDILLLDYYLDGDFTSKMLIQKIQEVWPTFFETTVGIGYSTVMRRSEQLATMTG